MNGQILCKDARHMSRALLLFISFVTTAILLASCSRTSEEPQPPVIIYGQDVCEACSMIISEARFAAASLLLDGTALKFDDPGDMLNYHASNPQLAVKALFVHDFDTEEWLRGETAHFVRSTAIKSPMGHGMAAFGDEEKAKEFAAGLGTEVLSFEQVQANLNHMADSH